MRSFRNNFSRMGNNLKSQSPSKENNPTEIGSQGQKQAEEKIVLIDTDAGTDDAWALFMCLLAHKDPTIPFNKIGITTVCGNTAVDNVTNNVTRTLDTLDETNIPVYRGMENPMVSKFRQLEDPPWHGEDGFGDANLPPIPTRIETENAIDAIIRLAEEHQGKLTIICLGPVTNLAMAVKIKPELKNLLKEVYILGGNVDGVGNVTTTAEYNFYVDCEAVFAVFDSLPPCPITLVPWETALYFASSTHDFRTETLGKLVSPQIDLLNKIEARILGYNPDAWLAADSVLTACIINPNIIKSKADYFCTIELNGSLTRGMMVVDKALIHDKPPNVTVILDVHLSLYESLLIWTAGGVEGPKSFRQ